jgi:hypothetical protein
MEILIWQTGYLRLRDHGHGIGQKVVGRNKNLDKII